MKMSMLKASLIASVSQDRERELRLLVLRRPRDISATSI
jgi:hypothetical protein